MTRNLITGNPFIQCSRTALLVAVIALLAGAGCTAGGGLAWQRVEGGADPVLVNAERADQTAFATIAEFMSFVEENRAILPAEVTTFHSLIAAHAPDAFRELRAARAKYRLTRASPDASVMENDLSKVEEYAREARKLLATYRTTR